MFMLLRGKMQEIPLTLIENEKEVLVYKINGGTNLISKLNTLGIYEGAKIKKLTSYTKGPVLIEAKSSKVAIGRGMAEKILVTLI